METQMTSQGLQLSLQLQLTDNPLINIFPVTNPQSNLQPPESEFVCMKNLGHHSSNDMPSTSRDQPVENQNWLVNTAAPSMRPLGCWFYTKFLLSIIGLVAGMAIFIVFFFHFHNLHAGTWGFLSGVFAAGVLHLHVVYMRGTLEEYHSKSSLTGILRLGLVSSVLALVGIGVYAYLGATYDTGYKVDETNYYPSVSFAFLTLKWTLSLAWHGRTYRRVLDAANPALLAGVRVHPDSDSEYIS